MLMCAINREKPTVLNIHFISRVVKAHLGDPIVSTKAKLLECFFF